MPALKFTKTIIEQLPYQQHGQQFYRDTLLKGLALRVGKKSKVYVVESQVKGKTVRVTIGKVDILTPEIARKKALPILSSIADGINPNHAKRDQIHSNITLQDAFDIFFRAKSLSKSSLDAYKRTVRLYLKNWTNKPLIEITRQMVLKKHQEISKQRGDYIANNVMRHLRSIYNFTAATTDNFPPNPVIILTQARAWNKEKRRRTLIPIHKLKDWYSAVLQQEEHTRDFLLIAIFTGMRRSEITTLRWEHIDLEGKTLHIPKTKNGDPLDLPISSYLSEVFQNRFAITGDSEWVFPSTGATGHLVEHKKFLSRVTELSGVKFTFHDLRRTFATLAESLNIPNFALKRLLNHRTDNDITGGYVVINTERLREPVEQIANRILELVNA